jgi:hypothetical protein
MKELHNLLTEHMFYVDIEGLAVQLTVPTAKCVVDFHHQVSAHAGLPRNGSVA